MHCRRDQRGLVAAALREVFNAEDRDQARERITNVLERLQAVAPKVCELLDRGGPDRVLLLPGRALDQDPLHQPARAGQQGDRPTHRRRRDLPQRRRRDPARRRAAVRTERRMAGTASLSVGRVDRADPRRRARPGRTAAARQGGRPSQRLSIQSANHQPFATIRLPVGASSAFLRPCGRPTQPIGPPRNGVAPRHSPVKGAASRLAALDPAGPPLTGPRPLRYLAARGCARAQPRQVQEGSGKPPGADTKHRARQQPRPSQTTERKVSALPPA